MTELEERLDLLGREIVFPPTPDLAPAVRARLARAPWLLRRRTLVLAVLALALATAGVLAVSPSARSAVLDLLGIRGVKLSRVESLPPLRFRLGEDTLGRRVSLAEAERLAPFELLVPTWDGLDDPDRVYHRLNPPGHMVTFVYEPADGRARLLVSQWYGSTADFFYKLLGPGSDVRRVGVRDAPGLWISGRPHGVIAYSYQSPDGVYRQESPALAGNVLLWEDAGISYRLEADLTLDEALEIARSLR